MGLTFAISIVNWVFGKIVFLIDLKSLMYRNNIVKHTEILNNETEKKKVFDKTVPIRNQCSRLEENAKRKTSFQKDIKTTVVCKQFRMSRLIRIYTACLFLFLSLLCLPFCFRFLFTRLPLMRNCIHLHVHVTDGSVHLRNSGVEWLMDRG